MRSRAKSRILAYVTIHYALAPQEITNLKRLYAQFLRLNHSSEHTKNL